jgi:hypothetical protein
MTARTVTMTEKVETPFGSLYIHLDFQGDECVGGSISSPGKNPDGTVEQMLASLSDTLNSMLREGI